MSNINLLIANATGNLTPRLAMIHAAFERATTTCRQQLQLDTVDVLFTDEPDSTIPEIGVGGQADSHLVDLPLDAASSKLNENEIYYALCHEFHHAKRCQGGVHDKTLFDEVVSEGLATCFEEAVSDGTSFIVKYLKKEPYEKLLTVTFMPKFDMTDFNKVTWFIEDTTKKLPRWAGYIVGYHIVSRYMAHTNKTAAELVLEPSGTIRQFVRTTFTSDPESPKGRSVSLGR